MSCLAYTLKLPHENRVLAIVARQLPQCNLMPYIAQVAVGRRDKLTVFGGDYPTPDGTCRRDYIHVMDLANGHLKAVEYAAQHKGTEVFNLGTGTPYSVLEIINAFEKASGVKIKYPPFFVVWSPLRHFLWLIFLQQFLWFAITFSVVTAATTFVVSLQQFLWSDFFMCI